MPDDSKVRGKTGTLLDLEILIGDWVEVLSAPLSPSRRARAQIDACNQILGWIAKLRAGATWETLMRVCVL